MIESGALNSYNILGRDRFDFYFALSQDGKNQIFPENAWQNIAKPLMTITGTLDTVLDGGPHTRRLESFENMKEGTTKWSAVIDGATYMHLVGKGPERCRKAVCELISHFIDTLLNPSKQIRMKVQGVAQLQIK